MPICNIYSKNRKNSDINKNVVISLKIEQCVMRPKDAYTVANSEDHDQPDLMESDLSV